MPHKAIDTILTRSSPDSDRFGLNVARAKIHTVSPKALAAELISSDYDIAIVRLPSGESSRVADLKNWALPVVHADTLVYYKCDLTQYEPASLRNSDLHWSTALIEDMPELESLILSTFQAYKSHYHASPQFPPEKILSGYQEWARNHIQGEGRSLWVARHDTNIVAFAACQHLDDNIFEGVLYGVLPEAAGRGLYGDLIRHTQMIAKSSGCSIMKVSTQVNNFAVQKVWAREGFYLYEAWDTFHIRSAHASGHHMYTGKFVFTEQEIQDFAAITGDNNPLHLSPPQASKGLAPIAHGVMTLGEISRILGTESPGPGTIILHMDAVYLRPVIAGCVYRIEITAPMGLSEHSAFEVVSTVSNEHDNICVIARCNVLARR